MSKLSFEEARNRIQELHEFLNYHGWKYYVQDEPEISDAEYDKNYQELLRLEKEFPELLTASSPSLRVGGAILDGLRQQNHSLRMYSLDNAFSESELEEYIERTLKLLPGKTKEELAFWADPKMDGLAMELIYEKGLLTTALTRGDGERGEVVTEVVRTIKNIPLSLLGENYPEYLEVRGEVIINKADFAQLNLQQEKAGLKIFANPRNLAAGSVKQLDSKITAKRPLRFMAYGVGLVGKVAGGTWASYNLLMNDLQKMGFAIPPESRLCKNLIELMDFYIFLSKNRQNLPFEIDGVVAKVNDCSLHKVLGYTAKAPRWAIALKFAAIQAESILIDIIIQVGRTGVLTPVAILEPVQVGGVTVARATLHNENEILAKDLKIGDWVIVQRAGDVIPEVVRSIPEKRVGQEKDFVFPKECPVCNNKVYRETGEVAWRCVNHLCPAVVKESIIFFASKAGLDIQGLGSRWIEEFVDKELVKTPVDLFKLEKDQLLKLERMGEKSASNFIEALENAKHNSNLARFICALGIRRVGEQTAKALAKAYLNMDALMQSKFEELQTIPDIGPEVAEAICEFFDSPGNKSLLMEFKEIGLWPVLKKEEQNLVGIFSGKSLLFTGSLNKMSRSEAGSLAEKAGAKLVSSVSSKLDYLIAGEAPGSKLTKAQDLGIKILNEDDFFSLLNQNGQVKDDDMGQQGKEESNKEEPGLDKKSVQLTLF